MEWDTIALLKELVAIDSQNPSLVAGAAGEGTIAGYVAGWAQAATATTFSSSALTRAARRPHR